MARVYFSLGSNVGDRLAHLREGVALVAGADPHRVSAIYETDPVGDVPQDDYLNLVLEVKTSDQPLELLARCQRAEVARGRVREVRWGPRTLDVDVIFGDEVTSVDPAIEIPHPRCYERAFVLAPWRELRPDLVPESLLAGAVGAVRRLGTLDTLD